MIKMCPVTELQIYAEWTVSSHQDQFLAVVVYAVQFGNGRKAVSLEMMAEHVLQFCAPNLSKHYLIKGAR